MNITILKYRIIDLSQKESTIKRLKTFTPFLISHRNNIISIKTYTPISMVEWLSKFKGLRYEGMK